MALRMGRELERMSREECVKFLERHPAHVGRIALSGPRPVIFPVNYVIDSGYVVFRTDPDTKFHAAVHNSYVAFEVDWVEPTWQIGWSVMVRGQCHLVTEPEDILRLSRLPLYPWADGDKAYFVRIRMELVSGRKLKE